MSKWMLILLIVMICFSFTIIFSSCNQSNKDDGSDSDLSVLEACEKIAYCDFREVLDIHSMEECYDFLSAGSEIQLECLNVAIYCDQIGQCLSLDSSADGKIELSCEGLQYGVYLTWSTNIENVLTYFVFRSAPNVNDFKQVGTVIANLENFTDEFLYEGNYDYSVSAEYQPLDQQASTLSDLSNTVNCYSAPNPPYDFYGEFDCDYDYYYPYYSNCVVRLYWDDESMIETKYILERKIYGSSDSSYTHIAELEKDRTSYIDDTIALQDYTYRICAKNSVGSSDWVEIGVYTYYY